MSVLDALLGIACEDLQLSPTLHELAERHYHAVARWLSDDKSPLAALDPSIFPQGSFLIGTTTRPILRNEYDLDFVCQMAIDPSRTEATGILDKLESRLRDHGTYEPMVKRLKRCVRLDYSGDFHMDILPAALDRPLFGTRVRVPDRKLEAWKPSDPKGFAEWFKQRSRLVRLDKAATIEPMPSFQTVAEKTPLQRSVQLLKRARDRFCTNADLAPRSVVLTTLAGQLYRGQASTAEALRDITNELLNITSASAAPLEVRNPANPEELLSEQWNAVPASYHEFRRWLDWFASQWVRVQVAGIQNIEAQLAILFGDSVAKDAVRKHAAQVTDLRKSGGLKVNQAGTLTTGIGAALVRPNTFYGRR